MASGSNSSEDEEDVVRRARNLTRATEGEVYPNIDNRSNLMIAQLLQGMWLVQLRERNESQKMEKIPLMEWHDEDQCFKIDGVLSPMPLTEKPPFLSVIKRDQMKRSFYKKEENDDVEEPYISRAYVLSLLKQPIMRERESPPQAPQIAWRCLQEDIVSSPFNEEMVEFPAWLNDEESRVEKQCVVAL
ncbi:uncharacterized protein LOC125216933 [Salvia hispanica]|uniref:uncharacterized protein LOC125216933 n=1 Tax=Salvia hispanica TaxID=49212 RepID=UPI00200978B7|nr:uncharacterized protein LOC125216933 [Salvia hispanica]